MKTILFLILLPLFLLLSCETNKALLPKEVEEALIISEGNRKELEKVISYFSKHEKDSLKLISAFFLISNMPYHTSVLVRNKSTNLMPYIKLADKKLYEIFDNQPTDSLKTELFLNEVDKIKDFIQAKMEKKKFKEIMVHFSPSSDIKVFDSNFLIDHIENAFTLREKPMVNQLSFHDFCEYILPYRLIEYLKVSNKSCMCQIKYLSLRC